MVFSTNDNFDNKLVVDQEQLKQFITTLFKYAEDGYVQFRQFFQKSDKVAGWPWPSEPISDLQRVVNTACRAATSAANNNEGVVFCPPVTTFTDRVRATKLHMAEGIALSVDCDQAPEQAVARLVNLLGVPTIVVRSGGIWTDVDGIKHDKLHLHWRLSETTRALDDHRRLEELRRLATIYVGADASNVPSVHPLRWPGSWHRKGEPRLCSIREINESAEIELSDALDTLRETTGIEFGETIKAGDRTVVRGTSGTSPARDPGDVTAVASVMANDDLDWDAWKKIGMAFWAASEGAPHGLEAFHTWSRKCAKYDSATTDGAWDAIGGCPPDNIGMGTLVFRAREVEPPWKLPSATADEEFWKSKLPPGTPVGLKAELEDLNTSPPPPDLEEPLSEPHPEDIAEDPPQTDHDVQHERRRAGSALQIGSDAELATLVIAELTDQLGELVYADLRFWHYAGTAWAELQDVRLLRVVLAHDGQRYGEKGRIRLGKSRIESIVHVMTIYLSHPDFFANGAAGVNCGSGFIRFGRDGVPTLEPHNPDHRCRHTLSAGWKGATELPAGSLLRTFLDGMFRDDPEAAKKEALFQELAGSAIAGIATKIKQPKAAILLGRKANNGKSTFLELVRGTLPASAVATISAGNFAEPRYRVKLAGRLLNSSDELSAASAIASDLFKAIVTGDPIAAHDVYRPGVEFRPVAQHIFATNRLPGFAGGLDKGVRRRLIVLEFERTIPRHEMISDLGERILDEEMSELLGWAIGGASRLIRKGEFTTPPSSAAALEKWTRDTDPVRGWIALRVEQGEDEHVMQHDGYSRPELYANFKEWAEQNGYRKDRLPGLPEFIDRLAEDFPVVLKRRENSRRIRGITVLTADRSPGDQTRQEVWRSNLFDDATNFDKAVDRIVSDISTEFALTGDHTLLTLADRQMTP
jgi:P4 family phage/plasmid primase-like protien